MKALASDFDGTIHFEDGFRESDLNAIKKFQQNGDLFGICTGRPLLGVVENVKGKIDLDFYIVSSGALILDKNFNVIDEKVISFEDMKNLYLKYKDFTNIFIQGKEGLYTFKKESVNIVQTLITDIEEVQGEIYGLSLNAFSEDKAIKICNQIKDEYHELDAFQNKEYIDIVKKGCSKGMAVKRLKNTLKLDMIAGIGDSYNDIPMLECADESYTFHSSPDIVKDKATWIVNSVEEAIDRLMK